MKIETCRTRNKTIEEFFSEHSYSHMSAILNENADRDMMNGLVLSMLSDILETLPKTNEHRIILFVGAKV